MMMKFDRQLRPATKTSQVVSYGGKTLPIWRTAAILKMVISPYLSEKSSDFHEILYVGEDFELDERHMIENEKVALDRLRVRQNVFLVQICITSSPESTSRFTSPAPPVLSRFTSSFTCQPIFVIIYTPFSASITPSRFHSKFKAYFFNKSFPPYKTSVTPVDCLHGSLDWAGLFVLVGLLLVGFSFKFSPWFRVAD